MGRKIKAFTLAEILIVLSLIGIFTMIFTRNFKPDELHKKTDKLTQLKVINLIDEASKKLMNNADNCPTGKFMEQVVGTWDLTTYKSGSVISSSVDIYDIFKKYIKFRNGGVEFCNHTPYCSATGIVGGHLSGNILIGFEKMSSIENCPTIYLPGNTSKTTLTEFDGTRTKCWAKLYIDTNGNKGPNTEGEDVFIYGIKEDGIAK